SVNAMGLTGPSSKRVQGGLSVVHCVSWRDTSRVCPSLDLGKVVTMEAQPLGLTVSLNSKGVRRSSSKLSLRNNHSTASLRQLNNHSDDTTMDDGGHPVSLAHELAAALMPEPSMTSRLLADEFGLEFDDGASGLQDDDSVPSHTALDATAT